MVEFKGKPMYVLTQPSSEAQTLLISTPSLTLASGNKRRKQMCGTCDLRAAGDEEVEGGESE